MPGLWDDATLPYTGQDQQPQDNSSIWGRLLGLFQSGQPFKSNNPALDQMMLARAQPELQPHDQPQPLGQTLMDLSSSVAPYLVGGAPAGLLSVGTPVRRLPEMPEPSATLPSVRLAHAPEEAKRLLLPENEQAYWIKDTGGNNIGRVTASIDGPKAEITDIRLLPSGGVPLASADRANLLGPGPLRALLSQFREQNPEVTQITGIRVSGAREGGGYSFGEGTPTQINLRPSGVRNP